MTTERAIAIVETLRTLMLENLTDEQINAIGVLINLARQA